MKRGNKFLEVSYWAYKNGLNSDEFWSIVLSNKEVSIDMINFMEKIIGDEKQ